MKEITFIDVNEKLLMGSQLFSWCRRFICGFKDRNTLGVYLRKDSDYKIMDFDKPVVEYTFKPNLAPETSSIFLEATFEGMQVCEAPNGSMSAKQVLWNVHPGVGKKAYNISLSDKGSLRLSEGFPDLGKGTIYFQTAGVERLVNSLFIRKFGTPQFYDEDTVCEARIHEIESTEGTLTPPTTHIDSVENYPYIGLKLFTDPIFPNESQIQHFYTYFRRINIPFPEIIMSGLSNDNPSVTYDHAKRTEFRNSYEYDTSTLLIMYDNFKLEVDKDIPTPASGKYSVQATYKKICKLPYTGSHEIHLQFPNKVSYIILVNVKGYLSIAYDPIITVEAVEN